jgi:hypothetical protein
MTTNKTNPGPLGQCLLVFALSALLFFLLKKKFFYEAHIDKLFWHYALFAGVGLLGIKARLSDAPKAFRIVLRGSLLVFIGYWATCYYSLPVDSAQLGLFVGPLRWGAVLCGVLAWFRPSFAPLLFLYTFWFKKVAIAQGGFNITPTDYTAVAEIGLFLSLGFLVNALIDKIHPRKAGGTPLEPLHLFLYLTIAIHFSNYFYSGLEKIRLDHSLTTWLLRNHTEYLILTAKAYGILPIATWLDRWPFLYPLVATGTPLINAISLFSQLLAIVAIFRIRWTMALTALFDLFHVAIFVLSGIFFWKWVILNLSIVWGLRYFPKAKIPVPVVILGMLCMVSAPLLFFIAKLGWFDTRAPVLSYVEALTASNKAVRVPSNYFLLTSVTFAQNRIGRPFIGHFPVGGVGIARDTTTMERANACAFSVPSPHAVSDEGFGKLEAFLRLHHRFILSHTDTLGRFSYDLYPHHIWSNPWLYRDFNALDKRTITGYRLVVESACLDYREGRFIKHVKYRSARSFKL